MYQQRYGAFSAFMKRLDRINEMYAREELFGIRHENGKAKDFARGDWTFKNYTVQKLNDTKDKKLYYLERCPRYSLFCDNRNHWRVFLGCKGDYMYFYDSDLHNKLRVLSKKFVASITVSILKK